MLFVFTYVRVSVYDDTKCLEGAMCVIGSGWFLHLNNYKINIIMFYLKTERSVVNSQLGSLLLKIQLKEMCVITESTESD